jgi:hypothetical protein
MTEVRALRLRGITQIYRRTLRRRELDVALRLPPSAAASSERRVRTGGHGRTAASLDRDPAPILCNFEHAHAGAGRQASRSSGTEPRACPPAWPSGVLRLPCGASSSSSRARTALSEPRSTQPTRGGLKRLHYLPTRFRGMMASGPASVAQVAVGGRRDHGPVRGSRRSAATQPALLEPGEGGSSILGLGPIKAAEPAATALDSMVRASDGLSDYLPGSRLRRRQCNSWRRVRIEVDRGRLPLE